MLTCGFREQKHTECEYYPEISVVRVQPKDIDFYVIWQTKYFDYSRHFFSQFRYTVQCYYIGRLTLQK